MHPNEYEENANIVSVDPKDLEAPTQIVNQPEASTNIVQTAPSKSVLHVTKRQLDELSQLDDDELLRFQYSFNSLVTVITRGHA